jgi:type II secretory pathway pseudopilin PulG
MVEAAVVLCVLGVVLAAFVPTFVRNLRTSKVSEAPRQLRRMHQAAASYYETPHSKDGGRPRRHCLPSAAGPAPAEPAAEPEEVDFASEETPGHATWKALGFQPDRPIRYSYSFEPVATGCALGPDVGSPLVRMRAEGDLDQDGVRSLFERAAEANNKGELVPEGILHIKRRVE